MLDLVVSERLMTSNPVAQEGLLSRARAAAVNTHALAELARSLDLGGFIRLSRGERASGGSEKDSILANVFEAILGALYLDGGLEPVRVLVQREMGERLAQPGQGTADPKTRLQERMQAQRLAVPRYELIAEAGPPHARKFSVEVYSGERALGVGHGTSKRAAEQKAAECALEASE